MENSLQLPFVLNTRKFGRKRTGISKIARRLRKLQTAWRRERDSNPRYPCGHSGFQDRLFQPLTHPSAGADASASFHCMTVDGSRPPHSRPGCSLEPVINFPTGGAGSQFFSVPGARSDEYRESSSEERRGNGENWPQPEGFHPFAEDAGAQGLRRKSRHTSLSSSTVGPPRSSDSASYDTIFSRNAASRES